MNAAILRRDLMMLTGGVAVKAVIGFAAMAAFLQAASGPGLDTFGQISQYGVTGFLGVAVFVLWRSLQEVTKSKDAQIAAKDELLMDNYRSMANALAANNVLMASSADTLDVMRHTLTGMKETLEIMSTVRAVRGGD